MFWCNISMWKEVCIHTTFCVFNMARIIMKRQGPVPQTDSTLYADVEQKIYNIDQLLLPKKKEFHNQKVTIKQCSLFQTENKKIHCKTQFMVPSYE